jgi:hypothetical protein
LHQGVVKLAAYYSVSDELKKSLDDEKIFGKEFSVRVKNNEVISAIAA